jgi:CheY-like chemotaxis protein
MDSCKIKMDKEKINIIVIDYDKNYAAKSEKVFKEAEINCDVTVVTNYFDVLAATSIQKFDMAFISSNTFKNNGADFIENLQKHNKYISFIYVLDKPDPVFSKEVMAKNASNCLTRAYLVPDVLAVLIQQCQSIRQTEITLQEMITENITKKELEFLTEISYQIRTPLNSIIGFSSALLEMEKTEKGIIFLQAIKSSGEKIVQILDEKIGEQFEAEEYELEDEKPTKNRIHFNEIIKMKILLVEDDVLNIKLIEHLFSDYGMNADIALNGKHAIELLEKNDYELILMDIELPDMNGYETTTYIREKLLLNTPIIALTAHALAGERKKCLDLGMNDYLSKPINANKLFESIYQTLQSSISEHLDHIKKVTNLQNLKEQMNGKKTAIKEMLDYLLQQVPIYIAELNDAVNNVNYVDISKLAHKIKSAILIMGAKKLEPILSTIEEKAKTHNDIDEIIVLNNDLNEHCLIALNEIKEEKLKIN